MNWQLKILIMHRGMQNHNYYQDFNIQPRLDIWTNYGSGQKYPATDNFCMYGFDTRDYAIRVKFCTYYVTIHHTMKVGNF